MMNTYDYNEAVKADALDYIRNNIDLAEYESREDAEQALNDDLWTADSVTGNGSGSYTFSTYKAEEYICHNLDLLAEACEEFGDNAGAILAKGAESADVTIRCYLLGQAIAAALDEMESAGELPDTWED